MFPLYDENRPNKVAIITIGLIFLNTLIFLFTFQKIDFFIQKFGMIPQNIFAGKEFYTILTSMFIHGSFWHLLGNMWFLWVFGNNLEVALGKFRYLIFYIICGIFSAALYAFFANPKTVPIIGASGAISGVLGGYFILFPSHKIKSIVPIFFFLTVLSVPAIVFLVIWVLYQVFLPEVGVAAGAHLIGFLAGIILVNPLKKGRMKKIGRVKKK
jgi:membrane associated rhomboid family serine protease